MKPIGRQCASGLSLLLSAMRFLTRSAAHDCIGKPSLKPPPTFPNVANGIPSGGSGGGGGGAEGAGGVNPGVAAGAAPRWPAGPRGFSQIPERSGLPSAVLGAGAVRLGLPSLVLGTPGAGKDGHCASSNSGAA